MKKFSHEYLIEKSQELYKKLDSVSMSLCYLKSALEDITELLKIEYEEKYSKEKIQISEK